MWWSYFDTQFSTCIKFSMFFQFSLDFLFAGYFSILTCFSHLENHPNTPTSHKLSSSHQIQFSKSPAAPGRRITVWIWRYMAACYSLLMKKREKCDRISYLMYETPKTPEMENHQIFRRMGLVSHFSLSFHVTGCSRQNPPPNPHRDPTPVPAAKFFSIKYSQFS